MRRSGVARRGTHCVNGHEWTDATRYKRPSSDHWYCRPCAKAATHRYLSKKARENC